jgi:hypothetical protein
VITSTLLAYDEGHAIREVASRGWYDCLTLDSLAFEKRVHRLLADRERMPSLEALTEEERCSIMDQLALECVTVREALSVQIDDDLGSWLAAVGEPDCGDELEGPAGST